MQPAPMLEQQGGPCLQAHVDSRDPLLAGAQRIAASVRGGASNPASCPGMQCGPETHLPHLQRMPQVPAFIMIISPICRPAAVQSTVKNFVNGMDSVVSGFSSLLNTLASDINFLQLCAPSHDLTAVCSCMGYGPGGIILAACGMCLGRATRSCSNACDYLLTA